MNHSQILACPSQEPLDSTDDIQIPPTPQKESSWRNRKSSKQEKKAEKPKPNLSNLQDIDWSLVDTQDPFAIPGWRAEYYEKPVQIEKKRMEVEKMERATLLKKR